MVQNGVLIRIGEGKNTRYLQWRDEVPKIKAKANSDEYEKLVEPWKTVEVLYIDDLFKTGKGKDEQEEQKPTAADINVAFEIINFSLQIINLFFQ